MSKHRISYITIVVVIVVMVSANNLHGDQFSGVNMYFFDQSFLQKIVLLVLTALITGFGVPYVLKRIDDRKLRGQKKFEADLARQGKIIEAQSKLLDDLSTLLWKWRYLAKKVAYYGYLGPMERYNLAKKEYDDNVWDILDQFRVEISRSRRLVSEHAYKNLNSLYEYIVYDIDDAVSEIIREVKLDVKKSEDMSVRFSNEVSKKLDDAIYDLASELHMKFIV
jgi:hypothetical protein